MSHDRIQDDLGILFIAQGKINHNQIVLNKIDGTHDLILIISY